MWHGSKITWNGVDFQRQKREPGGMSSSTSIMVLLLLVCALFNILGDFFGKTWSAGVTNGGYGRRLCSTVEILLLGCMG